jgi:Cysteine-rich secretory protein family
MRAAGVLAVVAGVAMTVGTGTAQARDVGYEAAVHRGINDVRQPDAGFGACVDHQAERWAHHLAETQYFHHSDIRATLRECNARWVGEIIAWGHWSPHGVIDAWLHSPEHRHVMLNHVYRRMGVASVPYGGDGERATVVQFIA